MDDWMERDSALMGFWMEYLTAVGLAHKSQLYLCGSQRLGN